MLNRSGHGRGVDWWSLGALLYEMLTGLPPFYSRDRAALFERIRHGTLDFPPHLSPEAVDLLQRLLCRSPERRLGCGSTDATEVKNHPFFAAVDWVALAECRVPPPWVPSVASSLDTSQFDAEFTNMPVESPTTASLARGGELNPGAAAGNTPATAAGAARGTDPASAAAASASRPSAQAPGSMATPGYFPGFTFVGPSAMGSAARSQLLQLQVAGATPGTAAAAAAHARLSAWGANAAAAARAQQQVQQQQQQLALQQQQALASILSQFGAQFAGLAQQARAAGLTAVPAHLYSQLVAAANNAAASAGISISPQLLNDAAAASIGAAPTTTTSAAHIDDDTDVKSMGSGSLDASMHVA